MPELTLITFNCFGVPTPITKRRLRTLAATLNNGPATLVCLQEVQAHGYRRLLQGAATAFESHAHAPLTHAPRGGLLTLSRTLIEHQAFVQFRDRELWYTPAVTDWLLHKGMLLARTSIAGQQVIAINTHLNANYSGDWRETNSFAQLEWKQLQQLADLVREQPADALVLVSGDFNIPRMSWLYDRFIERSGLVDPRAADPRPTYRPRRGMPARYTQTIDFALLRPPVGVTVEASSTLCFEDAVPLLGGGVAYLSDHIGIRLDVVW